MNNDIYNHATISTCKSHSQLSSCDLPMVSWTAAEFPLCTAIEMHCRRYSRLRGSPVVLLWRRPSSPTNSSATDTYNVESCCHGAWDSFVVTVHDITNCMMSCGGGQWLYKAKEMPRAKPAAVPRLHTWWLLGMYDSSLHTSAAYAIVLFHIIMHYCTQCHRYSLSYTNVWDDHEI